MGVKQPRPSSKRETGSAEDRKNCGVLRRGSDERHRSAEYRVNRENGGRIGN